MNPATTPDEIPMPPPAGGNLGDIPAPGAKFDGQANPVGKDWRKKTETDIVVGRIFAIGKKIGSGAFGDIYQGLSVSSFRSHSAVVSD